MAEPAIKVEGLSKEYRIGATRQRHTTFYDLLSHAIKAPFRRPAEGAGPANSESSFLALRDVNFAVQPGDTLGIIGRNGAGKSTLLKILSRITDPTEGRVTIRGRVASLLEVGTGFHPELTGRENIFLNGAILGMKRREIAARFDEIVDFAEVDQFIDTPVKRYSSGMIVRLAFAVAAHLDPDVLIADEVLAVGDAAFQKKSLGKMGDAAKSGRTVLFVSHNLGAVRILCRSALLLESGRITYQGPVEAGVAAYERTVQAAGGTINADSFHGPLTDRIRITEFVCRQGAQEVPVIDPMAEFEIEVRGAVTRSFEGMDLKIGIFREGYFLAACHDAPSGTPMREGRFQSRFRIAARAMKPGRYTVGVGAVAATGDWTWGSDVAVLDISENWGDVSAARDRGVIGLPYVAERIQ